MISPQALQHIADSKRSDFRASFGIEAGKYPFLNLHLLMKKLNTDFFMGTGTRVSHLYILFVYSHAEIIDYPSGDDLFAFFRDIFVKMFRYRKIPSTASVKKYTSNISVALFPYFKESNTDVIERFKALQLYKLSEIKLRMLGKNPTKQEIMGLPVMSDFSHIIPVMNFYDIIEESGIIIQNGQFSTTHDSFLKQSFHDIFSVIKKQTLAIVPQNREEYRENTSKTWIKFTATQKFYHSLFPKMTEEETAKDILYILGGKQNNKTNAA